jgi:hypothetical protein
MRNTGTKTNNAARSELRIDSVRFTYRVGRLQTAIFSNVIETDQRLMERDPSRQQFSRVLLLEAGLVLLAIVVLCDGRAFAEHSRSDIPQTSSDISSGASTFPNESASGRNTNEANRIDKSSQTRDSDPMGFFGIGLKVGYLNFGKATYSGANVTVSSPAGDIPTVRNAGVPARSGMVLSFPITIGGSGFGWIFDPYLGFEEVGAYGLYTGPRGTFQLSTAIYLSFGLGIRFDMITAKPADAEKATGIDVYGRIPVDLYYYPIDDLGVIFELAVGYGVTGYKPTYTQQYVSTGKTDTTLPKVDLRFGDTFEIDFSTGIRFP